MQISRIGRRAFIPLLIASLLISACSAISVAAPTKDVSTNSLMPNISGYTRVDTGDVQGTLANMVSGASALTGNLPFAGMVKVADRLAACYRQAGAFSADVYTNQSNPLLSGAILIINNRVTQNLNIAISCASSIGNSAQDVSAQPCTKSYTLTAADGNTFQVFYAATDQSVCASFCSVLQGCA